MGMGFGITRVPKRTTLELATVFFVSALTLTATAVDVASPQLPSDDRSILHLLNRTTFGPRPGDIDRVRSLGVRNWIDLQLHPERIPDAELDAQLGRFETLKLSTRELAETYFLPALEERRRLQRSAGQTPDSTPNPRMDRPEMQDQPGPRRPGPMTEAQRGQREVMGELVEQKLLRAASSERQLQEVLVDFWFNHFNVSATKGTTRFYLTEYERDVIRPHVFGAFRDLLGATAKSPAMLFYLDNWMNSDPNARVPAGMRQGGPFGRRPGTAGRRPGGVVAPSPDDPQMGASVPQPRRSLGINENYARELMELHTLGVDGGYTQHDVAEVARAFTGWSIDEPRRGGNFVFRPQLHDNGEKVVLGQRLASGGGQRDGDRVLDLLSRHPSTARFISTKLAKRFVSDTPPQALIDRMAETFRKTDGDLREVMRTLLLSPEFFADDARRAKVKTPLEFVVSAVRATDNRPLDARALGFAVRELGMPLYQAQPPTGYSTENDAWVTAGALMARMNFAVTLTNNRPRNRERVVSGFSRTAPGNEIPTPSTDTETSEAVDRVVHDLLQGDVSASTRATLMRATSAEQMTALALGSPEFQRR
jgi:uncharacterized protein (DUF1800 family)